jgi:hypothetical protein
MGYFCNCKEINAIKNTIPKSWDGYAPLKFHAVDADKNEICPHCRYQTFFSRIDPENAQRQNLLRLTEVDIRWKAQARLR